MREVPESVSAFLRGRRFAAAGVSRDPAQPANAIYRRLRAAGYAVFPVNSNAPQAPVHARAAAAEGPRAGEMR